MSFKIDHGQSGSSGDELRLQIAKKESGEVVRSMIIDPDDLASYLLRCAVMEKVESALWDARRAVRGGE